MSRPEFPNKERKPDWEQAILLGEKDMIEFKHFIKMGLIDFLYDNCGKNLTIKIYKEGE